MPSPPGSSDEKVSDSKPTDDLKKPQASTDEATEGDAPEADSAPVEQYEGGSSDDEWEQQKDEAEE